MAPRPDPFDELRRGRRASHSASAGAEAFGIPPAGLAGTGVIAGFLRPSFVCLRRTDVTGQRLNVERRKTSRLIGGDIHRHVSYRKALLEDRSEAGAATKGEPDRRHATAAEAGHPARAGGSLALVGINSATSRCSRRLIRIGSSRTNFHFPFFIFCALSSLPT